MFGRRSIFGLHNSVDVSQHAKKIPTTLGSGFCGCRKKTLKLSVSAAMSFLGSCGDAMANITEKFLPFIECGMDTTTVIQTRYKYSMG